jgi:sialate O-acetylesterase
MKTNPLLFILLLPLCAASSQAAVRLPAIFSDHMVLQQNESCAVWGWADAGEAVTVSIAGKSATATAGADGKWSLRLPALIAGGPHTMEVKGTNTLTVNDVLVGEVWLGSGQSNMDWTLDRLKSADDEIKKADYPKLRMFTVARTASSVPVDDCKGKWVVCSGETVGGFSATLYHHGRELQARLNVPMGLIKSSWGGTPIQTWTNTGTKRTVVPTKKRPASNATPSRIPSTPGHLFNGMIAPLIPYTMRGVVWYQGERNTKDKDIGAYGARLESLIGDWRRRWGADMPFAWVQLPEYMERQTKPVEDGGWVAIREQMLRTLRVKNTGMAIALGLGEAGNIHPQNKRDVGKRLALWALDEVYGRKEGASSGPLPDKHVIRGNEVIISFAHADGGLKARDGKLIGFAIAGADQKFVWADARIEGDKVIVSSADVKEPKAVRYAWANNPLWSLENSFGLPASPFRTDNWKLHLPPVVKNARKPEN